MTQRPGKAVVENEDSEVQAERDHLRKHVHLTNCIHLRNHLHLQKRKGGLMLDARRPPLQLPLMREVTALQKLRTLRDPATSSSSVSASGGSSGGGGRGVKTFIGDPHKDAQALAIELSAKLARTTKVSSHGEGGKLRGENRKKRGEKKADESGILSSEKLQKRLGRKVVINVMNHGNGGGVKETMESNHVRKAGEVETGVVGAMKVDVRDRIKNIESAFHGAAPNEPLPMSRMERDVSDDLKEEAIMKESNERGRKDSDRGDNLLPDERWHGDARRREKLAQRVIMENNGSPSSLSLLLSNPRGSTRSALTLDLEDHQSDVGESLFHSDEGELSPMEREMTRRRTDANLEPPLVHRDSLRPMRQKISPHRISSRKKSAEDLARPKERRNSSTGFKEAPTLDMDEVLDVSELPGCGMPWDCSRIHKYGGKAFMDLTGLTRALPEAMKRHESMRGRDARKAELSRRVQSISSLDSDANPLSNIIGEEDAHDSDFAGYYVEAGSVAPAQEKLQTFSSRKGARRGSLQNAVREVPANTATTSASKRSQEELKEEDHRTLSQKYRPKHFKELVGQSMVVKSLSTAIVKGKVAPVYLFMGPRGTGKTSAGKIFATGLNCLSTEPTRRPCGICRECRVMSMNRSSDVKEIDAASNGDLPTMRAAMLDLVPRARYKVFIVEGCDSLSMEIWNAFLKVLEDPPRNVVFILITTDADRIPQTAASRCQKFPFSKIMDSDIVRRLEMLAVKEGLEVEEGVLSLIAARSDGSLRDAEITLDQLSLLGKQVSLASAQELVGILPGDKLLDLLDFALSADTVNTVRAMREILSLGVDPLLLVSQLGNLITDILVGSVDVDRGKHTKGFFKRNLSIKEEQQRLRQALKILSEADKQLRGSSDRSTWLTAALLQFAPDRSFLPSSVTTSVAQSPTVKQSMGMTDINVTASMATFLTTEEPRPAQGLEPSLGRTLQAYIESRRKDFPLENAATVSERKLEEAWAREPQQGGTEIVEETQEPGVPVDGSEEIFVYSEYALMELWNRVIRELTSRNLKHLLQTQARLVAACVASDGTSAVVELEFEYARDKHKAERSWRSICHAFQAVLGATSVELRIQLVENPLDEAQLAHNLATNNSAIQPKKHESVVEEVAATNYLREIRGAPLHTSSRRRSKSRKHEEVTEILEHELEMQHGSETANVPRPTPTRPTRGRRLRRRGAARPIAWASTAEQYSSSFGERWDPGLSIGSDVMGSGQKKVTLSTMMEEPQSGIEDHQRARIKLMNQKSVQFRTGSGLTASKEHKNLSNEPRWSSAREGLMCCRKGSPRLDFQKRQPRMRGLRRARGKALFLRLVPCSKLNLMRTRNTLPGSQDPS